MRPTTAALVLLLLIAGFAWLAVARVAPPEVVPATAPAEAFSAERAMTHVEALAHAPRPVGGEAHAAARAYVVAELEELGLEPEVWTGVGTSRWGTTFGTMEDVIARVDGEGRSGGSGGTGADRGTILLMAHYDSVTSGPGASDDAVGVATLLETLRALLAGPAPANDVVALFTDGEELGLLGAEAFAHGHPLGDEVDLVLNFEARGTRGPALMFETGPGNRWTIERFADGAPYPAAASYSYEVYRRLPNDTDYSVFKERRIPGLNFAHIHGAVGYHTAMDSIEHLDPRSLQHHGSNALGVTRELAGADLAEARADGDAVYFNPLGSAFVHFPASWVLPLVIVLGVGALVVIGLGISRRRVHIGRLVLGVVVHGVILVILGGLTLLLRGVLFPGRYDFRIWGEGSSLAFTLFGLTLLLLGAGALLHRLGRRFLRAEDLAASGLLLWLVVGVAASLAAPGASYLFLVPLLFQVVGSAPLLARSPAQGGSADPAEGSAGATGVLPFALLALAAVVTALIWAPTLALLAVGLRIGSAVILAVLSGLVLALLAPQVELITAGALRWAVPGGLVAAAVVVVAAVQLTGGFGPDNPRPDTLFYALDADSGEAVWASFETEPDDWTSRVLSEEPEVRPLLGFLGRPVDLAVASAAPLELPAPELEVPAAAGEPGGPVRLRLVPPPEADGMRILLTPRAAIEGVRVQGRTADLDSLPGRRPAPDEPGGDLVVLWYVAPPAEGVEIEVDTSDPEALEVAAIAQWWRLPGTDQGGPGPRDATFMQAPYRWDSDTTMVRRHWSAADLSPVEDDEDGEADGLDGDDALANPEEGAVQ
ncbi:MAG: M20/M25/M40 family metallo-hydrolase [Acidobacteriota bacterium]|jgi:hypothetical protein